MRSEPGSRPVRRLITAPSLRSRLLVSLFHPGSPTPPVRAGEKASRRSLEAKFGVRIPGPQLSPDVVTAPPGYVGAIGYARPRMEAEQQSGSWLRSGPRTGAIGVARTSFAQVMQRIGRCGSQSPTGTEPGPDMDVGNRQGARMPTGSTLSRHLRAPGRAAALSRADRCVASAAPTRDSPSARRLTCPGWNDSRRSA